MLTRAYESAADLFVKHAVSPHWGGTMGGMEDMEFLLTVPGAVPTQWKFQLADGRPHQVNWPQATTAEAPSLILCDSVYEDPQKLDTLQTILNRIDKKLSKRRGATSPNGSSSTACTPEKNSRRGRKRREGGLDCEAQMLALAEEDPLVPALTPTPIRKKMIERWGEENAFSVRKIRDTDLYKAWRSAVDELRKNGGMTVEEALDEKLEIWSHKPGREDKRKEGRNKAEKQTRECLAALDMASIEAKRRVAARNHLSPGGRL